MIHSSCSGTNFVLRDLYFVLRECDSEHMCLFHLNFWFVIRPDSSPDASDFWFVRLVLAWQSQRLVGGLAKADRSRYEAGAPMAGAGEVATRPPESLQAARTMANSLVGGSRRGALVG